MDTLYCIGVYKLGESNAARIFIFRMWIGYGFDAAQIAMAWINTGFTFMNDHWRNVFLAYLAFIFVAALILTFLISRYEHKADRVVYLIGYFKLTATVTACFIFFQLYFQDKRDPLSLVLMVVTGADIAINFIEMAAGFAGLDQNRIAPLIGSDTGR